MITVVGIGADGWEGLGERAREALTGAPVIVGSRRQLDLLPQGVAGRGRAWPSPMDELVDQLAAGELGDCAVLASGDPMLHGVAATLVSRAGVDAVRVLPAPSAFALACARLGWAQHEVELVSAVARPSEIVARSLQPGRRIVVYVTGADGAARLARVLCARGFGASRFTVLEQLGGPRERRVQMAADDATAFVADPLHLVAIVADGGPAHAQVPGRPDEAYRSDGQLTKRHVRAITLGALAPLPGELLWDVGSGSGSVSIEWLRAEPSARAIAIEARDDRAARIAENALSLGVPELRVVRGRAPGVLDDLPQPDVIFVGGGVGSVLVACWSALRDGGRLVANTVTLEGEQTLLAAAQEHGGTLTRIDVAHAEPVGQFQAWRAQMTIVQWSALKEG